MSGALADSPAALFAAAVADAPAQPLITFYDDRTGERTELSAATLGNWVAKTANLLVDEAATAPGDRAGILLPAHWQTAAVLLGCWTAGLTVTGTRSAEPVDVVFAAADQLAEAAAWRALETYGLALAPMAAPLARTLPEVPAGVGDYVVEVRAHGDHFLPAEPVDPETPAFSDPSGSHLSHRDLATRAAARAEEMTLVAGDRLLVVPDDPGLGAAVDWLLAPLAAGASVVLCAGPDLAGLLSRADTERVTITWGVDIPGRRRAK